VIKRLLIIPAAGLGSRLRSSTPKVLFPVNGKPMIDYLLDLYAPVVDRVIVVLHPSVEGEVRRHCTNTSLPIEYAIQGSPTGMLDAILIPDKQVQRDQPASIWITWCDQIAVHPKTVMNLAILSCQEPDTPLIFPTVNRRSPYIHLVRNERHEIVDILHRREGDDMPQMGESDMGLFCLSRDAYCKLLPTFSEEVGGGAATRERNFLPFIPWLRGRGNVRTFPAQTEIESVGINTLNDLERVGSYLRNG